MNLGGWFQSHCHMVSHLGMVYVGEHLGDKNLDRYQKTWKKGALILSLGTLYYTLQ